MFFGMGRPPGFSIAGRLRESCGLRSVDGHFMRRDDCAGMEILPRWLMEEVTPEIGPG
jgi:hypothetical protein